MVRTVSAPTRQLHSSIRFAVSGSGHIGNYINSSRLVIIYLQVRARSGFSLRRIQPTLRATRRTPSSTSRWVQAMSAWSVKPRHAPFRHSRDARVYVHTTTAMHKYRVPHPFPPPPPPLRHPARFPRRFYSTFRIYKYDKLRHSLHSRLIFVPVQNGFCFFSPRTF